MADNPSISSTAAHAATAVAVAEPKPATRLDEITAATDLKVEDEGYDDTKKSIAAFLKLFLKEGDEATAVNSQAVTEKIAEIDRKLSLQMDAILHHPTFQSLESAWRGLEFAVNRMDFRQNIKVGLLNCSKDDLLEDFRSKPEPSESGLFKKVYTEEYGVFGGEPFGAIIANYDFSNSSNDVELLRNVAAVATMAHVPFIAAAAPKMFDEPDFLSLANQQDIKLEGPQWTKWNSFRKSEDARNVGLTLPRFLGRRPYHSVENPLRAFTYDERIGGHDDYLWINASYAFATRLAESFKETGWCAHIVGPKGGGAVENLPVHLFQSMGGPVQKIPTEILISDRLSKELSKAGFISLDFRKGSDNACFFEANSCQMPKYFGEGEEGKTAEGNYKLGTRLPYTFVLSRLAHYLKVLQREEIGRHKDRETVEHELNMWLRPFISNNATVQAEVAARRPLRSGAVTVEEHADNPGWYTVRLTVVPHVQLVGMSIELSLVGKLERDEQH